MCCIIFVFCFQYLYHNEDFEKPFFSTYVKTSMFTLYLLGLCFWPPWRDQCSKPATYMVCSFCYNKKFMCVLSCMYLFLFKQAWIWALIGPGIYLCQFNGLHVIWSCYCIWPILLVTAQSVSYDRKHCSNRCYLNWLWVEVLALYINVLLLMMLLTGFTEGARNFSFNC